MKDDKTAELQGWCDLLAALLELNDLVMSGRINTSFGICGNILHLYPEGSDHYWLWRNLTTACRMWDKFSGDVYYPVPAPTGSLLSPLRIYSEIENQWEGEYGDLRRELLAWCIEYASRQV